jgi:hypothetical protein
MRGVHCRIYNNLLAVHDQSRPGLWYNIYAYPCNTDCEHQWTEHNYRNVRLWRDTYKLVRIVNVAVCDLAETMSEIQTEVLYES